VDIHLLKDMTAVQQLQMLQAVQAVAVHLPQEHRVLSTQVAQVAQELQTQLLVQLLFMQLAVQVVIASAELMEKMALKIVVTAAVAVTEVLKFILQAAMVVQVL
jgi:hypothetical protein